MQESFTHGAVPGFCISGGKELKDDYFQSRFAAVPEFLKTFHPQLYAGLSRRFRSDPNATLSHHE
jgi:hypothetical protein